MGSFTSAWVGACAPRAAACPPAHFLRKPAYPPGVAMRFSITDERIGATTYVVHVRGEVDLYYAPQVKEHLFRLLDSAPEVLIVDLDDVTYLDSTGLTVLMSAHRRAEEAGGRVLVARARGVVADVFEITGLDGVFGLHDSVEAALAG